MVDLTTVPPADRTRQRSFHLDDATHDRLQRAADVANVTMSAMLRRMIWEDIRLPGDPPTKPRHEEMALD